MKLTLTSAALLLALLTLSPAAAAQTCTCNASEASCGVSVTCSNGCSAVCTRRDACYATCGDAESRLLSVRVTLAGQGLDAKTVSDRLTTQAGTEIVFSPRRPKDTYNLDNNDMPLYHVLKILAKRGKVTVRGRDFKEILRIGDTMDGRNGVTVKFNNLAVRKALDKLYFLTGQSFTVESGDADALVSLTVPNASVREVIAAIEKQANVKIGPAKSVALK